MLTITAAFATTALIASVICILLICVSTRLAVAGGAALSIEVYHCTVYQSCPVFAFIMKVTMDLFNIALQAIYAPIYIKYGGAVNTAVELKWRDVLELIMKDMSDY